MAEPINSRNNSGLHEALVVFASPECLEDSDCVTVDLKDSLQDSFQKDPQKRFHLAQGLNRLVDAYRFVSSLFTPQSSADQKTLYEIYFAGVKEELKKGGVGGAVFGDLEFFKMGLEAGHIPTQEAARLGMEGIILGYTLYLQEQYDIELNWGEIKEKVEKKIEAPPSVQESLEPESVILSVSEESRDPSPPEADQDDKKVKQNVNRRQHDTPKTFPPIPKVGIPAAKILPFNETDAVLRKKRDLEVLAAKTGGRLQDVITPHEGIEAIEKRLTLETPKKDYQVMFLIDASGSMDGAVEELKKKVDDLMEHAREQLGPNGKVSFGVRYYVDETSERPTPFDNQTPKGMQEVREGLSKAIAHIKTTGGGAEYHWDVGMESLKKDPWVSDKDVEKVIFVLTDEEGNISEKKQTSKTVADEAKKKNVRFEVIRVLWGPYEGWYQNAAHGILSETIFNKYKDMTLEEAEEVLGYSFLVMANVPKRAVAIWKLGHTASSRFVVPSLINAIDVTKEPSSWNRQMAAEILGKIGDTRAIPYLAKALEAEKDHRAYMAMAVSLGQLGDFRGPSALGKLFKRYANDRLYAITILVALGNTRHPLAVPYLIDVLKKENHNPFFSSEILNTAERELEELWELALPEMVKALQDPAFKNAPGRKYLGEALLYKASRHPNILQLFNLGNPLDATKEPNDELRHSITLSLMLQEDPAYLQILTLLQNDRSEKIRDFAKDGIRRIEERQTPR